MRTNVELDDRLVDEVMRRYRLRTKREAVDLALRRLVDEPLDLAEALALEGSGWDGDLAELRKSRRATARPVPTGTLLSGRSGQKGWELEKPR
jgi:Arc/MetJ family transcription regulator